MRIQLAVVAILLAAAGCSNDSGGSATDRPAAHQSTSPPPTLTLADICPEVEANFPAARFGFPANDKQRADFGMYADNLKLLVDQIEEPQRAMVMKYVADIHYVVQLPEDPYLDGNDEFVMPALEASETMDEAVGRMASACADAGVPIFK